MTTQGPASPHAAPEGRKTPSPPNADAFDIGQFEELTEMLGEDGVMEMIAIFEVDTRKRLDRLAAGTLDMQATIREVHTLKGAAGTVACPSLAAMGAALESAARQGKSPEREDLLTIEAMLELYLTAVRGR